MVRQVQGHCLAGEDTKSILHLGKKNTHSQHSWQLASKFDPEFHGLFLFWSSFLQTCFNFKQIDWGVRGGEHTNAKDTPQARESRKPNQYDSVVVC